MKFLFAAQRNTSDDFGNFDLPKANTFGLDIFMEGNVVISIPHSLVLANLVGKRQVKSDFQVLQVLNCIFNPNFLCHLIADLDLNIPALLPF